MDRAIRIKRYANNWVAYDISLRDRSPKYSPRTHIKQDSLRRMPSRYIRVGLCAAHWLSLDALGILLGERCRDDFEIKRIDRVGLKSNDSARGRTGSMR